MIRSSLLLLSALLVTACGDSECFQIPAIFTIVLFRKFHDGVRGRIGANALQQHRNLAPHQR